MKKAVKILILNIYIIIYCNEIEIIYDSNCLNILLLFYFQINLLLVKKSYVTFCIIV